MFSASFPNGGAFLKKIIQIIKDDIPEPTLTLKKDGITIQSMDKSHVVFVNIVIRPEGATHYECDGCYSLGINCDTFLKFLNCGETNTICILSFDESQNPDTLNLLFKGNNRKTFKMKLMNEASINMLDLPNLQHACYVSLKTEDFQQCIKDMSVVSDDVTITRKTNEMNGNILQFKAQGDTGIGVIDIPIDICKGKRYLSSTYSLKYLSWFAKAASLCQEAIIGLDRDFPLLLHFENDIIDMRFFLAPKINDNEQGHVIESDGEQELN